MAWHNLPAPPPYLWSPQLHKHGSPEYRTCQTSNWTTRGFKTASWPVMHPHVSFQCSIRIVTLRNTVCDRVIINHQPSRASACMFRSSGKQTTKPTRVTNFQRKYTETTWVPVFWVSLKIWTMALVKMVTYNLYLQPRQSVRMWKNIPIFQWKYIKTTECQFSKWA
jgi:hypothetical protein